MHKQISGLTVPAIVLLSLLLLTLIALLVVFGMAIIGTSYTLLAYILMGVELILAVITSIYAEKFQISHSKKNLAQYKKECKNLEEHLTECGLVNGYIPKLVDIYKERINRIEEKIKHKHETIHRFMEMLLIPISAAILGAVLDKGSTVEAA